MEMNQVQSTTMLQFHIYLHPGLNHRCSCAVVLIGQQWPVTLLVPSDFIDFMIFFPLRYF